MKFSFESPLAMLTESLNYNDYDYALAHLFEKFPEYPEFFAASLQNGREVYLDNGAYELGESFDPEKLASYASELASFNPDKFWLFLPDRLGDGDYTLKQAKTFPEISLGNGKYVKRIGVVQGQSYTECVEMAKEMALICDMIAFSMLPEGFECAKGLRERTDCRVRLVKLVSEMMDMDIIARKPIHLLGCLIPQEFREYEGVKFIKSADTSNPILHGLLRERYTVDGLLSKASTKMQDLMDKPVNACQHADIMANLEAFFNLNANVCKDELSGL